MPTDRDLFAEEQTMVAMSFGDHIEDLRTHLVRAIVGLVVGVILTFVPPLNLGKRVMDSMLEPGKQALKKFDQERAAQRARDAAQTRAVTPPVVVYLSATDLARGLRTLVPGTTLPAPEALQDQTVPVRMSYSESGMIEVVHDVLESKPAFISLGPLETVTIFFMVCLVTGLVISSPWVLYQLWAFVAAGLYRHERHYVHKFLPFSIGLFLGGVFLCYFGVLPITLKFLLQFNVWLNVDPTMRLSEWMSFATILPLVFGICFETPLVMLFLARIGIFTADDYRAKRKIAILIMVIIAAVLTPGPDVSSQLLLAVPMLLLYELGILLVGESKDLATMAG